MNNQCSICNSEAEGEYFTIYYGKQIGAYSKDIHFEGTGQAWTDVFEYQILGSITNLFCKDCIKKIQQRTLVYFLVNIALLTFALLSVFIKELSSYIDNKSVLLHSLLVLYSFAPGLFIGFWCFLRLLPENFLKRLGELDSVGKRAYFENKIRKSNKKMLEQKYGKSNLVIWGLYEYNKLNKD
jgi:hypothetical protein